MLCFIQMVPKSNHYMWYRTCLPMQGDQVRFWVRKILWRRESWRALWTEEPGVRVGTFHGVTESDNTEWSTHLLYTLSRWSKSNQYKAERSDTGEEGELKVEAEIWVVQLQRYAGIHQKLESRNFLQNLFEEYIFMISVFQ